MSPKPKSCLKGLRRLADLPVEFERTEDPAKAAKTKPPAPSPIAPSPKAKTEDPAVRVLFPSPQKSPVRSILKVKKTPDI